MRILCVLLAIWTFNSQGQTVVIKAGHVVDPASGTISEDQIILVRGTRIQSIGADTSIPDDATVVDLSDSYVMPGLIDAHTHLCNSVRERDAGRYFYTGINATTAERAIDGIINAQAMLNAGFTSVRDLGSEGNYACTAVRTAFNRRELLGPTIMNAGRIIAPFGAQYRLQPEKPHLAEPDYYIADTRDEMLKAIRENIHFGARVLKVIVDDQSYIYSEEDLRYMRQEAEKAGFKLAAHAWTENGILNAANAGVHSIEHVTNATSESFEVMVANNVAAVFTNLPPEYSAGSDSEEMIDQNYRRKNEKLKMAYEAGVKIVFGSDIMENKLGDRGESSMLVVNSYDEAGLNGLAILRSMTSDSAELLGINNLAGNLGPNMWADIVATTSNPLENIRALHNINFVMKWGSIARNDH